MTYMELFVIAVGLSMDAFAVSVCKGLSVRRLRPRQWPVCISAAFRQECRCSAGCSAGSLKV